MTTTYTFDSYATNDPVADGVNLAGAGDLALFGISSFAIGGVPEIGTDSEGNYAGQGQAVYSLPPLAPAGLVTRIEMVLDLPTGSEIRILLPILDPDGSGSSPDDLWYVYVAADRSGGSVTLSVRLTEDYGGAVDLLIGMESIADVAADRVVFTVEAGPRFVRAWLGTEAWERSTPDVSAMIPHLEGQYWGWLASGSTIKIRSAAISNVESADETSVVVSVDSITPDVGLGAGADDSRLATVLYAISQITNRHRLESVFLVAAGDADFLVADSVFNRLDPFRTLLLLPDASASIVGASTANRVSGPQSSRVATAFSVDVSGAVEASIGSGVSDPLFAGELVLDLPRALQGTQQTISFQDFIASFGGLESRVQFANQEVEVWSLSLNLTYQAMRIVERVMSASGGTKPVWSAIPRLCRQEPTFVADLSASIIGPSRIGAQFKQMRVRKP